MMKNLTMAVLTLTALTACENRDSADNLRQEYSNVSFALTGDFALTEFEETRALAADGKSMTDLWVMDYDGDGNLVQQMHQSSGDDGFGSPQLSLSYGSHVIRFVAARGKNPQLSATSGILTWESASDTFWAEYPITVDENTAAVHNVTLGRMSSRLNITVNDAIPSEVTSIDITPAVWYRGLNFRTGGATGQVLGETVTVNIPSSRAGATGTVLTVFSISPAADWSTDVTVTAHDADDNVVGQAVITGAPMRRNRTTAYSGQLFAAAGAFSLQLAAEWEEDYSATW